MNSKSLFDELSGQLKIVFGDLLAYQDEIDLLPELVNNYKSFIVDELYPAISLNKKRETRLAACHLYPPLQDIPIDAAHDPHESPPPTFPQSAAMLSFWAALTSLEFRSVVEALLDNDLSHLDRLLLSVTVKEGELDRLRWHVALDTMLFLYQAHENMTRQEGAAPVKFIEKKELAGITEQWKSPRPLDPYYNQAFKHLLIRINPFHDVESIVSSVRDIVTKHHANLRDSHYKNWSKEERDYHGDSYIEALDPVKEFTAKDPGSKGRGEQTFIDNAFHSLLVFELRQTMKPVEIERQFFGMEDKDYYAKMRDNNRRNALAERIINNVLSGFPVQT